MDNKEFNVKGEGLHFLEDALKLAFHVLEWRTAVGYRLDKKKGLVLYWHESSSEGYTVTPFITPMTAEQIYPQVVAFLNSEFAKQMELTDWDKRANDCDIQDYAGWRIYTETWGEVDEDDYAFLAITPSWCWSSK